jgi:hypothetical protein
VIAWSISGARDSKGGSFTLVIVLNVKGYTRRISGSVRSARGVIVGSKTALLSLCM